MKNTKKKVFVVALAVSLIAIIAASSLAWFNAKDDITNTFKVATNDQVTDPDFSVDVFETDLDGNKTQDGVTYYDVIPGDVIDKDPTIQNTGDYTQWVRVSVTMTKADWWEENGGSLAFTDIFSGSTYGLVADVGNTDAKWLLVEDKVSAKADGTAVWYLYLNREVPAGSDELLFNRVKIEEDFTLAEIEDTMKGEFNITVKAEAVQRDNTGDNAVEAFQTVGWDDGTEFVDAD